MLRIHDRDMELLNETKRPLFPEPDDERLDELLAGVRTVAELNRMIRAGLAAAGERANLPGVGP